MTHKQPSGEARRPVADSTDALPDQVLSAYNRSLIEASLDPLVTISKDGKIMDVNAATETATGCSRKELIGTDFSQYFTEPEKAKEGYEQVFSNGFVRDYPLAIRSRSGKTTEVLYNATVYRDEDGEIRGVFAAARDITERKHMEEQLKLYSENLEEIVEQRTRSLRESEERYRSLVDSSPDGVIVRDGVRYVYVNSAFAKLLGASSPDEIIGKNILDFVHPDDREVVSARMPLGEQGRTQTVSKLLRLDKG